MNKRLIALSVLALSYQISFAGPEQAPMAVWVNEAIVATYSFSYKNYLNDQKFIAKYFTADGWIAYTKAMADSKLPESIAKNQYVVSAVATEPPTITHVDATHWKATMPLLVLYENPQYKQQQHLKISINFGTAPSGQGVRGYSMSSLRSEISKPPCQCISEPDVPPNVGTSN